MIEFGGIIYFIDLKQLDKAITPDPKWETKKITEIEVKTVTDSEGKVVGTEKLEKTFNKGKEIDAVKYEVLRQCIEVLIDYDAETDESLGAERALGSTPLSYKLAFNTLIKEGILIEVEE